MTKLSLILIMFLTIPLVNAAVFYEDGYEDGDISDYTKYGTVYVENTTPLSGAKSLKIIDPDSGDQVVANVSIPRFNINMTYVEIILTARNNAAAQRFNVRLINEEISQDSQVAFGMTGGQFFAYNGTSTVYGGTPQDSNNYELRIVKSGERTFNYYVNGSAICTNCLLRYGGNTTHLQFDTGISASNGNAIIIDDVSVIVSNSTMNIEFIDEITLLPVNNVTYKVLSNDYSVLRTTNQNNDSIGLPVGEIEIEYTATDYSVRSIFLTSNGSEVINQTLYLINNSKTNVDTIYFTVTDESGLPLSGAIAKAFRRFVSNNSVTYQVVEMFKTPTNGESAFTLEKEGGTYQFVVEYLGNTVLRTQPTKIFGTTQILSAVVSEDVIESTVLNVLLEKNLSYDNNTNTFSFYFNDPSNTIEEVCLYVDKIRTAGKTIVNSSCLTANTGTIYVGIGNVTGNYIARAVVDTTTTYSEHLTDYLEIVIDDISETLGTEGLFWFGGVLTLAVGATFAFLAGAIAGILGAVITLIFTGMFGLVSFGWGTAMFIITMAIVLIIGMARSRL